MCWQTAILIIKSAPKTKSKIKKGIVERDRRQKKQNKSESNVDPNNINDAAHVLILTGSLLVSE